MTATLERREGVSIWERFCAWITDFDAALAPFGMEAPAVPQKRPFKVRMSAPMAAITNNNGRRVNLYYI